MTRPYLDVCSVCREAETVVMFTEEIGNLRTGDVSEIEVCICANCAREAIAIIEEVTKCKAKTAHTAL